MLRAGKRVLKPGGVLSFFVIAVAEGLSAERHELAVAVGPQRIDATPGYSALMQTAGFEDVVHADCTSEYEATLAAWIREYERESEALEKLLGRDEFLERQELRSQTLEAVRAGLVCRFQISAVRR